MNRFNLSLTLALIFLSSAFLHVQAADETPWTTHTLYNGDRGQDGLEWGDGDQDGYPDLVSGFEIAQKIRIMRNPGIGPGIDPTAEWESYLIANTEDPEDALFGDMDEDGYLDVLVSQGQGTGDEGYAPGITIVWAPQKTGLQYFTDPWTKMYITDSPENAFLFALPLQIDGLNGPDIIASGQMSDAGANCDLWWFEAPANPRVGSGWTRHKIGTVGGVWAIRMLDVDADGDEDILIADVDDDNNNVTRGVRWYENPGPAAGLTTLRAQWTPHALDATPAEMRYGTSPNLGDLDGDGIVDMVLQCNDRVLFFRRTFDGGGNVQWTTTRIMMPVPQPFVSDQGKFGKYAKDICIVDLNGDGRMEMCGNRGDNGSFDNGIATNKWALFWMDYDTPTPGAVWDFHLMKWGSNLTGKNGLSREKWERIFPYDVDGDGDMDLISNEKKTYGPNGPNGELTSAIGIVWMENVLPPAAPPAPATNPSPTSGATDVSTTVNLSWSAGAGTDTHTVHFGTSATPPVVGSPQPGTTYNPGPLLLGKTYYWQVDETNVIGTTPGTVWSFSTPAPGPGDFDGDGDVDADDLTVWKTEYGNTIDLQVYDGAAFLVWQRNYTGSPVLVPNVFGLSQVAAGNAITGVGLVVGGSPTDEYHATVGAGLVTGTTPAEGTPLFIGNEVNLVISLGPPPEVAILSGWTLGTTHAAPAGSSRAVIFTAHGENDSDNNPNEVPNVQSVTYGGQAMTLIIEDAHTTGGTVVPYVAFFILDEAGIAAATNSNFVVTWNPVYSPLKTPEFSSIFLASVNQTTLVGASASNSVQGNPVATAALATANGDFVILAGTHQKDTGTFYNTNNGFTEAYGQNALGMAIIAGHKFATGSAETPSISHSITNKNQVIIGAVIQSVATGGPTIPVGSYISQTEVTANGNIVSDGLTVGTPVYVNDAAVADTVIGQSPSSGTQVAAGSQVILTVSLGPVPPGVYTITTSGSAPSTYVAADSVPYSGSADATSVRFDTNNIANSRDRGEIFLATSNYTLDKITIRVATFFSGVPGAPMSVEFWENDSGWSLVTTSTGDTVPGGLLAGDYITFDVTNVALISGRQYCFVPVFDPAAAGQEMELYRFSGTDVYPAGQLVKREFGSSRPTSFPVNDSAAKDLVFYIQSVPPPLAASAAAGGELAPAMLSASSVAPITLSSRPLLPGSDHAQAVGAPVETDSRFSSLAPPVLRPLPANAWTTGPRATGSSSLRLLILKVRLRQASKELRQGKTLRAEKQLQEILSELEDVLTGTAETDPQRKRIEQLVESVKKQLAKSAGG